MRLSGMRDQLSAISTQLSALSYQLSVFNGSLRVEGLVEDFLGAGGAPGVEALVEGGVGGGEDFCSEQRGVGRAGLADGQRADGNAPGHLHDGEECIEAV